MRNIALDGKNLSEELLDETKQRLEKNPTKKRLAIISVGERYSSKVYMSIKKKKAEYVGLGCDLFEFHESISQEKIEKQIKSLAKNKKYAGIMIQHPLPKYIDEARCCNLIPIEKDVDAMSDASLGRIIQGKPVFLPATVLGIMKLLENYKIDLVGKEVLVIGKSQIVGLPLSIVLMKAGATVTVAHSRTKDLKNMIKNFDIVISAVGKPNLFEAKLFNPGQIIIDAGYNEGKLGDIDPNAYKIASYYSPVPGGVGPMTVACLIEQTVNAIENF